jgi:hypothetical protein
MEKIVNYFLEYFFEIGVGLLVTLCVIVLLSALREQFYPSDKIAKGE